MSLYLYQCSYTPESLAAQIKDPQDRLEIVNQQLASANGRIVAGGYAFGEHDITCLVEAPDDVAMASFAMAIAAGGAVHGAKTTKLLNGAEWVAALRKASSVGYRPAR